MYTMAVASLSSLIVASLNNTSFLISSRLAKGMKLRKRNKTQTIQGDIISTGRGENKKI